MKKLGLTGGIGVGKTYVSKVFQQMGIPVFNADVEAKNCMAEDKGLDAKCEKLLLVKTCMIMECFKKKN